MTSCKYCSLHIDFDDDLVSSRSGKKIPLDAETGLPHNCIERPWKITKYRNCNQEIFFSPDRRNPANGKLIPQNIFGNHRCMPHMENW